MLLSKDRSSPEISVPINVTENTPMIIPSAVRIDRVLLARTAEREMRIFSKNNAIIRKPIAYLL
jgi:hypothetical protein